MDRKFEFKQCKDCQWYYEDEGAYPCARDCWRSITLEDCTPTNFKSREKEDLGMKIDVKEGKNVDMINEPPHYKRPGAMQCFDEFLLLYGIEAAKYACLFNIHKYRYRAADKNGMEDLKKSDWYMNKFHELCQIENH